MIREYRTADCEDVLSVWAQASAVAHSFLSQEFLVAERRNVRDAYLPNANSWIWEVDGHAVAFKSLLGNEIGGIFVDPKFQRSGIGRALVDQARTLRGDIEVEVFEMNRSGRMFYAKLGFEFMYRKIHGETGLHVLRLRLATG